MVKISLWPKTGEDLLNYFGISNPWKKKEPIKPQEVRVDEILAKVFELRPECKYVFWFERMISPQHIHLIRDDIGRIVDPDQVVMIAGVVAPQIYEFEEMNNGTTVTLKSIASSSGEESKPRGSDPNSSC